MTTINFDAFSSCDSLKTIVIPNSVVTLGANIFRYCENVVICCEASSQPEGWDSNWNNNGFTVIWGIKSHGITDNGLAWVELDDGNVSIVAYYGDDRMLVIPDEISGKTVTSVASRAFYLSEINYIIIPSSITNVGSYAFYNYSTVIYCEVANKPEGWHNYWCYSYAPIVWGCYTTN